MSLERRELSLSYDGEVGLIVYPACVYFDGIVIVVAGFFAGLMLPGKKSVMTVCPGARGGPPSVSRGQCCINSSLRYWMASSVDSWSTGRLCLLSV